MFAKKGGELFPLCAVVANGMNKVKKSYTDI